MNKPYQDVQCVYCYANIHGHVTWTFIDGHRCPAHERCYENFEYNRRKVR